MIFLTILDSGHTIDLPGMGGIKTPASINITKMNIGVVTSILKQNGIVKYEITSRNKVIVKKEEQKIEHIAKKNIETVYVKTEDTELKNKVENIENLLVGFLKDFKNNKQSPIYIENGKSSIKEKEIEIDEKIDFIPTIDISGMTSKGDITQTTTKNNDGNIEESANLLKSLNKNNLKKRLDK